MATITVTPIKTFVSGEIVTPAKLNDLAESVVALTAATIVNADVSGTANIALSKLATGALPVGITVTSGNIVTASVTNAKLATDLDASKLTAGTLPIARIADGAVVNAKLATGIDASKLTTGTLPIARIADGSVTTVKILDEAVTTAKIDDLSVTTAKIANLAITEGKILNANVTTAKIDAEAVTAAKLADSAVITAKLADSAVITAKLADSAVTTAKINNAAITAAKLNGAQTGSAPIYGCRAWVRFDGQKNTSGSASATNTNRLIIASGNVSSVLRTGEGIFTVTFTTPMPTEVCAAVVSTRHAVATTYGVNAETNMLSASAVQIVTGNSVSGAFDPTSVDLAVFA